MIFLSFQHIAHILCRYGYFWRGEGLGGICISLVGKQPSRSMLAVLKSRNCWKWESPTSTSRESTELVVEGAPNIKNGPLTFIFDNNYFHKKLETNFPYEKNLLIHFSKIKKIITLFSYNFLLKLQPLHPRKLISAICKNVTIQ